MRALLACILLSGCIVPAPTSGEKAAPEAKRGPPAQPVQVQNGANLGDKVEIQGLILNPGRAYPGDSVRVSAFFKVLDEIPADYMVFVHVEDIDGRVDRLNADHAPAGGANPTSKWKKGDVVRDDFQIYVPPTMQVRGLNVLLGFWDPKTDQRLVLKNPDAVRHDGANRILVAQIPLQN
ncbi:MAG: hypothetical protein K1X89_08805 [Myxococcaceae bacterium]|nr:hypothetical protein [Myxococcaceae bacterium]